MRASTVNKSENISMCKRHASPKDLSYSRKLSIIHNSKEKEGLIIAEESGKEEKWQMDFETAAFFSLSFVFIVALYLLFLIL